MSAAGPVERVRAHARAMSDAVTASAPAGAVSAVFAGGSVASGDVAWFDAGAIEVYSDIDLYVVARAPHLDAVRAAAREAAAMDAPAGLRFLRDMDVGVYTREDLLSQPARPGTVSLAGAHLHLYGDESLVADMAAAVGQQVDAAEGLYLLENRFRELACADDAAAGAAGERLLRYRMVKTVLDCVAALQIGAGAWEAGEVADNAAVAALERDGWLSVSWNPALVEDAVVAAGDLQAFLARPGGPEPDAVRRLLLESWRKLAGCTYGVHPDDWGALLLTRCNAGGYVGNFREFLALSSGRGRSRPGRALAGARMARYSAIAVLRLEPMIDAVRARDDLDESAGRSIEALRDYLDRLTGTFGFRGGRLGDRAADMHRMAMGG